VVTLKIQGLIAKDIRGIDTEDPSKNGLQQERKETKRISIKAR
jgi:hypothetical protein